MQVVPIAYIYIHNPLLCVLLVQALHAAAAEIKSQFPHIIVESSGGVTEDTLSDYMGPHVDVISLSKTTQVSQS